jgi:hypothetical protein
MIDNDNAHYPGNDRVDEGSDNAAQNLKSEPKSLTQNDEISFEEGDKAEKLNRGAEKIKVSSGVLGHERPTDAPLTLSLSPEDLESLKSHSRWLTRDILILGQCVGEVKIDGKGVVSLITDASRLNVIEKMTELEKRFVFTVYDNFKSNKRELAIIMELSYQQFNNLTFCLSKKFERSTFESLCYVLFSVNPSREPEFILLKNRERVFAEALATGTLLRFLPDRLGISKCQLSRNIESFLRYKMKNGVECGTNLGFLLYALETHGSLYSRDELVKRFS